MKFVVCPNCYSVEFAESKFWGNWVKEVRFKYSLPDDFVIDECTGMKCTNCGKFFEEVFSEDLIVKVENGKIKAEGNCFDNNKLKEAITLFILEEIKDYLKEEGYKPIGNDPENRKFYLKLYCNWYTEEDEEYLDWDIEAKELVILGKKYDPEAFDLIVEDGYEPSHFYDLTLKTMEITEGNMLEYLEYDLGNFLSKEYA